MNIRGFVRGAGLAAAVLAASFLIVPSALARVHVGVGISVPGVTVGVGNCWNCGYAYAPPPPVYYQPVYAGPAYYPRHYYYRGYDRGYRSHHYRGGYYHHGHR
jgi:hypothetical protein